MVTFEQITCPKCLCKGDIEITADKNNFHWDFNFHCYAKTVFCYCHRCNADFTINELWDFVGFDEDSVSILKGK